jgi:uncharacterized protein DUF2735
MSTNLSQGSARIYQFPAGGRAALGGRSYEQARSISDLATSTRVNEAACSSCWYHEEAIREADTTREH